MDPFKNHVDDRTSYTDLDEQFYDARLSKDSLTQGDWPSQIDRAAIDVTYGVALGTTDSAFDHGATIGRLDFGTACGPHYVDGLRALAGAQSDLPQLISEHDTEDIGDLVFRLNELRVELIELGIDDSELGSLNRATEALIEKLITQHGDEQLSRQPLQQPEAVADLLYQLFSDPAVTNYADILIDSITADTGSSIGGDSLLTHLDRPQMVTPLWDHQQRAITNWVANDTTGYVNMATATGKTVLGLAAIAHLFGNLHPADTAAIPSATHSPTGRATVLIVAGQDLLLEQWQSEFDEHLNIPRSRTETDSDGDRRIELAWGDIEFRTAQELLASDPGLHYDLVILDEAHRYSTGRRDSRGWRDLFEDLTTNAESVLAMSGSIDDEWLGDSGVKDALEANLTQCIEFGITEAREQNVIADFRWDVCYAASTSGDTLAGVADSTTTLTPAYDATAHKFTPHELAGDLPGTVPDTFETLRDLRSFAQSKAGKDARDNSEAFDTFATAAFSRRPKRWQLNPPYDTIRQLLTEHLPERKAVVLVQSYAQADAVSEHLADWFDADTVYTPAKDEAAPYDTITAFKRADTGVLVGPGDVLGVGVDLPDAGIAVNLAKGGVNASLIQRIGRILRNPTGDKHAHFYHVVTIPGDTDARIAGEDGRRLLRRAAEFRALGSRFREHPGFVAVTDTTSHILRDLETAGARATIADHRDTNDMVDDDVARTLLDELIDEIEATLDDTRDTPVLTTYWQPESLTPGVTPVRDSVDQPDTQFEFADPTEESGDTTPSPVTVTVTDTDGTPISNAAVIAETTADATENTTDGDGIVTITPPTSGSPASLFVSRAGYQNQTHDIPADEDTVAVTLPDADHTVLTGHAADTSETDTTATSTESPDEPTPPSRDELIGEIQRVDGVLAGYPTLDDMDTHSRYAAARYSDVFDSWTDALDAADIDPEQRVIDDIQRVADQVDGVPTVSDITTHSHYTPSTLGEHFGSSDAAIAAAGVHDRTRSRTPSTDTDTDPESTDTNPDSTTHEPDTTEPSSSTAEPEMTPTETPAAASTREDLLSELQELASNWDSINRKLLYSVGDHHPDEYEDAFGSLDAALVEAGVADPDTVRTVNSEQSTSTDEQDELIAELHDLAEDWDTIDRKLLYSVGSHHPDEYDDAFGSVDAALVEAGLADPDTADPATTTESAPTSDDDEPAAGDDDGSNAGDNEPAADAHDGLIAELQTLADDWDTIDRKLLYSVGDHHPDEYDDAFGSLDAALDEAGVTDTIPTDADTAAETDENPTDTPPATPTETQSQSPGSSTETDLPSNELAELYVTFDRFQHLLAAVANELDTDGTTPMEQWATTVADHWGETGPAGAPNYGVQQRDRNDFSIRDYRDTHGDGDRVTDFEHVEFAPVDDRITHLVGDAVDDWNHAVPVTPESKTALPVAISSTDTLETAIELLDEFPAYPDADEPAPTETEPDTDSLTLPDGRIDSLTVTVLDHDPNPGSKRDARLQVQLQDGTEMPLDIWATHDLSLDWTVGDTYTLKQARHKSWETSTGTSHQLSSTKALRVTPGNKPDIDPPVRTDDDTTSTSRRTRNIGTSSSTGGKNRSSSTGTPSRSDLLNAVKTVADTIDRPLKASDVGDVTQYSVNDVTQVFGSWQNALNAAGIDNETRLIEDLRRVADEIGHRPTTTEMNEHGHVSATTYATYFGTYTAACEQAFNGVETTTSTADTDNTDQPETKAADTTEAKTNTNDGEDTRTNDDDGIVKDIMSDLDGLSESKTD